MLPFDIPDTSKIEVMADWVEFYVSLNHGELSKKELGSYIECSSGSEPPDKEMDDVWLELEGRARLYGKSPPFMVESSLIRSNINWEEYPEYMACLIFSLVGNPTETVASGRLFERISEEAGRNYISGDSILYGSLSKLKVEQIAELLNERFIYEFPGERKDRNLDVVVWKPFDDNRCSQIVVLIQCAAGHYWKRKLKELNLDAWCKYIHFACKPIKGFSIPRIISDVKELEEISTDGGVIIDRARIYRNIINVTPIDNLRDDLKKWCDKRHNEILK